MDMRSGRDEVAAVELAAALAKYAKIVETSLPCSSEASLLQGGKGTFTDGMLQWYFADEFSPYDAALLIAGHNPASQSRPASSMTREIIKRMRKDYGEAHSTYSFDKDGFYPATSEAGKSARKSELLSVKLNELLMLARIDGDDETLLNWILSDESDFDNQNFSRDEIRRWLVQNGLQHVYDFARPANAKSEFAVVPLCEQSRSVAEKQVIGKSESSYLCIIGALCDLYWRQKYPDNRKLAQSELLEALDAYREYPGLSERNLKDKLPKAMRLLQGK